MDNIRYGRKRSGIRRQLQAKLNDWIESIEDEELQKAIKRDVIVTGGSIASMLLGEKINDYDVYFTTKQTTIDVARYYVKQFVKTNNLMSVNAYVPEVRVEDDRVLIWMQSAGVAGEGQSVYAYFEQMPEDDTVEFAESLAQEATARDKPRYRPVFLSDNAISLSDKVQIVIRFYGEPDQIHENYDFIHACNWYRYKDNHLELKLEALESLMSRHLQYRGSLYPIASIFRMKKFIERGWRITAGQQLKIMMQISELNLKDPKTLREQLIGVDLAYMWQLLEALKDVDPEKINAAYVGEIIDRIFE
jgi:hypothetical protein